LADEENDTNNTVKVFTPSAAVTNTLRSSYQAAANYVERLLAPREYSDAAASVIAGMDDFAEFDVTAATAETSRKHAANKAAIAWTTPEAEDSEFKRFELDILAALKVLDPGIKKGYMRTSPTQDLSHLTQDLNGPQVRDEYRLIFAAHDQIGSITERTQLNTSCANNGWQLVVFGKTSLTHNNNRFFVNMYHDATSGKYVVSTHPNANSSKFTEYQDAIIKIAQTLKNNRRQMTDDFSEESSWRYRDSSTTTAGAGAGTGAGTGAGSSAPMLRRAEPTTALIAEQTAAKNAFDLLDLRETAKFFSKIKQSLIPAYIASAKIACLEVNNLTDPNNKSFIEQHRIAHRTCVAFSNNNESEIRTFFERLHADYCNNVFIVHGYEHSKALHDTVTIFKYVYENYTEFIMDRHVTQSKGRLIQEHISLQKFKDILLTPLPPVSV
jgi:hypothetical protein